MCGIVGYIGNQEAAPIIFDGLTRLEYRGYDSAGIAVIENGKIEIRRALGKLNYLKSNLEANPLEGKIGLGHTRWATHGKPSEVNAHPHRAGRVVVVHNGIIENYAELRKQLQAKGRKFQSQTDTEVVAHLIDFELSKGLSSLKALQNTLKQIKGSYALVVLNEEDPTHLYVARYQSPLVLGLGANENFVASDVPALLPYTREVIFLEDGDYGFVTQEEVKIYDQKNKVVEREVKEITWNLAQAEKGGFKHFMLKEIFESPRAFIDTLRGRVNAATGEVHLKDAEKIFKAKQQFNKIYLVACGTSYHAALLGKFYFEQCVGLPVIVDVASEFRYRNPPMDSKTLLIAISQSGETADTLVAVKNAKKVGAKIFSICNVIDASIPRVSDAVCYTLAGPEIGVAATKTYITQMEALLLMALQWGSVLGKISKKDMKQWSDELVTLPQKMEMLLKQKDSIRDLALRYVHADHFMFIGRGYEYPNALEGALKLKEISYIHSEGYPAGELKHGPIAMIDSGTPVIALAPKDLWYEKMLSNIEEVLARGAAVLAVVTEGDKHLKEKVDEVIEVPETHPFLYPFLMAIPLQLIAYEIANHKGHDVDQPRNLAKSVTVE